jgi:hypothetical protein
MWGMKARRRRKFFLTHTLSYVSFSAFSEAEIGFVLRGFIALSNGESPSQEIRGFISLLNTVVTTV